MIEQSGQQKTSNAKSLLFSNRWLLSSVIVTLHVSLCYGLVGLPFYATNDDGTMTAIVSGTAYVDSPDEHTLFSHAYHGLLLKQLYLALPGFPWYGLFEIAILIISMTVLIWLILGKSSRQPVMLAIAFGALLSTCVRPLLLIQFTTTAALAACAGTFLLIESVERWHLRKRAVICGIGATVMIALSTILRDDSANLILVVMTILILSRLLPAPLRHRRRLTAYLVSLGASFALVFALNWASLHYYQTEEWKDFLPINAMTFTIRETRCDQIDSPLRQSMYRSVGWSPADAALFLNRYSLDDRVYNLDKLTTLSNSISGQKASAFNIENFISSIRVLLMDPALLPLLFPALLIIPFVDRAKVPYASWLFIGIGILSLSLYLILSMKLPMRVLTCILLPLTLFAVRYLSFSKLARVPYMMNLSNNLRCTIYGIFSIVLAAPSIMFLSQLHVQLKFMKQSENDFRAVTQSLSAHSDRIYVDWAGSLRTQVSPFTDLKEVFQDLKIIPLSATYCTPFTTKRLRELGIDNLLRQLDRENIVVISNEYYNRLIRMYAAEKLGKEVILTRVPVKPSTFQAFKVKYVTPADPEKLKRDLSVGFHTD